MRGPAFLPAEYCPEPSLPASATWRLGIDADRIRFANRAWGGKVVGPHPMGRKAGLSQNDAHICSLQDDVEILRGF